MPRAGAAPEVSCSLAGILRLCPAGSLGTPHAPAPKGAAGPHWHTDATIAWQGRCLVVLVQFSILWI